MVDLGKVSFFIVVLSHLITYVYGGSFRVFAPSKGWHEQAKALFISLSTRISKEVKTISRIFISLHFIYLLCVFTLSGGKFFTYSISLHRHTCHIYKEKTVLKNVIGIWDIFNGIFLQSWMSWICCMNSMYWVMTSNSRFIVWK